MESNLAVHLMLSSQAAALQYAFFAERRAQKLPFAVPANQLSTVRRVAIFGCGDLGAGLAACLVTPSLCILLIATTPIQIHLISLNANPNTLTLPKHKPNPNPNPSIALP